MIKTREFCFYFRVFHTLLSDAETCLLTHLPDYCESSVSDIVQQRIYIFNMTGFDVGMCLGKFPKLSMSFFLSLFLLFFLSFFSLVFFLCLLLITSGNFTVITLGIGTDRSLQTV